MKPKDLELLVKEMDNLLTSFTNCRAYFPYMDRSVIGHHSIHTAPYYIEKGFYITFSFEQPLTEEIVRKNNKIGIWINQNFIVRLCAMLESYGILPKDNSIDKSIEGWEEELELIRRLRNIFAHTSGKYNVNDKDHTKLFEELIRRFNPEIIDPEEFPLAIDKVIAPLFEGCKKYVLGKQRKLKP